MTNARISATSPADVLAYVPHALGFTPRESFVFLTMNGKRLGATLRIDAPQQGDPAEFALMVLGYLSHDVDADGVLFIAYTDQPTIDGIKPFSDYAHALDSMLDAAGTPIRDSWLVNSESWVTYFCEDADCCSAHPLEEITDSALSARLVYEGSNPGRETVADPEFTGDGAILDRITDLIAGWTITDPADWAGPVIAENRALWQETLGTEPTKDTASQLLAALHTPAVRDRIIADTISTDDDPETFAALHTPAVRDRIIADTISTDDDPETFATVLTGRYTGAPDWEHVDATQELLIDLLRFTPPEARAPLFATLGWIHWYKGRSSIAAQYLTKALNADPDHTLSQLLTQLVNTGTLPECVKHQHTAYQR